MSLKLNVIVGSTRPGRGGLAVSQWVADFAAANSGFEVELVDLADFNLPLLDEAAHPVMQQYEHEHTRKWSASVASADAYIFVTPEYDSFPSAALVNAIQLLVKEWARKPAGVVGYAGISGGLRAVQPLRSLISGLNVHALPQVVPLPNYSQYIGDDGVFVANEVIENGARIMLDELQLWAKALKPLRAPVVQAEAA